MASTMVHRRADGLERDVDRHVDVNVDVDEEYDEDADEDFKLDEQHGARGEDSTSGEESGDSGEEEDDEEEEQEEEEIQEPRGHLDMHIPEDDEDEVDLIGGSSARTNTLAETVGASAGAPKKQVDTAKKKIIKKNTKKKKEDITGHEKPHSSHADPDGDVLMLDSGDEAVVKGAQKRKKKARRKRNAGAGHPDGESDLDESGGEGGWIKTRAQRAAEKSGRRIVLDTSAPTVDIDAIFARLKSGAPPEAPPSAMEISADAATDAAQATLPSSQPSSTPDPTDQILIKRTYMFAGKKHTEEKLVPRDSDEAKLYLSTQQNDSDTAAQTDSATADKDVEPEVLLTPTGKPRRGFVRARRSIFEPVIVNMPVRTDLHIARCPCAPEAADQAALLSAGAGATAQGQTSAKTGTLNTVQKSALDWAGYVDKAGLNDELKRASKKKGAYGERVRFLARVEDRGEVERRKARGLPGVVNEVGV